VERLRWHTAHRPDLERNHGSNSSGTPTAAGTSTFTIEVEDDNGFTATKEFSVTFFDLHHHHRRSAWGGGEAGVCAESRGNGGRPNPKTPSIKFAMSASNYITIYINRKQMERSNKQTQQLTNELKLGHSNHYLLNSF